MIASSSDNLFHPVSHVPSSYVFSLPTVPSNPRHHANNSSTAFNRPLPYHSPFSSYNNPTFTIPHHAYYNHPRTSPVTVPLGPPPPLPPRPQPIRPFTQPHSFPHMYNHPFPVHQFPQPAYRQNQPAYYQHQPAFPVQHQPTYHHSASPFFQNPPLYQNPALDQNPTLSIPSSPSPPSSPLSSSKTFPTVTHIPFLTSKHDFFPWDEAVSSLIRANGLIGHILDPLTYVDPTRLDIAPSPPPVLSISSTAREIEASNRWWARDNIAQHILLSRLGPIPRGLIPAANIVTRTALSIYEILLKRYGTSNFADCTELLSSLHNSVCSSGRIQDYVSKWRTGLSKLQSTHFVFSIKICVALFVRGLPSIPAFNTLRADLPRRIAAIAGDHDFGAFIDLTDTVLELDTIFRPSVQPPATRPPRAPAPSATPAPPLPLPPTTLPEPSSRTSKKECNNCKSRGLRAIGHTDGTCFQPGGGMEGRREEYLSNKGRIHAMLAECLENALMSPEPTPLPPDPHSPCDSPILSPALDNEVFVPPIAHLSVAPVMSNFDVREDVYSRCEFKLLPRLALATVDFNSAALLSLTSLYNALLDSGCTHHIVRERSLFRNYIPQPVSVGTANCGSLEAHGTGDVEFRYIFGDRRVIFTLRGCLYAPSAPINLLSVGALAECGMSCTFSPGGITKVSYPEDHPRLPGLTLVATVVNRLSFLNLVFIPPDPIITPTVPATALPAIAEPSLPAYSFPRIKLDSTLWHRRFGHIGMDATRATLMKNYVKGVQFDGPFIQDHCIPCLVGKSPQRSYTFHGHRATKIGELLHMDLCGPFPVQAPRGEKYFFNILDDNTNWGFTFGLRLKSDAFQSYLAAEAFLERSNATVVLAVRCGGELELMAGQMGAHFTSKGITLQRTVPYAHQQNGKSERYIRTIEEGGQTLLADSGLPMSFWLDAVLTRQYLVNRLPTSTLPVNTTPYEAITNGQKPDLSHLRVWGCDCYVAIPDEIRGKAGPKRLRAIFVGYEEHRIGWRVRDLKGKYSFSNDVIFNENLSGRLGIPRSLTPTSASSTSPRVLDRPHLRTSMGRAYDDIIAHKKSRNEERKRRHLLELNNGIHSADDGVAEVAANGGVISSDAFYGGATGVASISDLSPSIEAIESFISFLDSSCFSSSVVTESLVDFEMDSFSLSDSFALKAFSLPFSRPFDLSKPPSSYTEAVARPDAPIWHAAMDRERESLASMGAFEEVDLPKGERAVGLKWVYDIKTDANGDRIHGKEKARLVAQGFSQWPGQYDETYAPVAKLASVRILLAWAAVKDLEIFQFDCKTAFLHAKIRHPLYARPFPGYPISTPGKFLRILVALYGLRQSAYEFYILIMSLLLEFGMVRCEIDHGVFFGEWMASPDPSITMPLDGQPLVLYVPLHVDDGLAITNSKPLYDWFLSILSKRLHVVDLGPCAKFLNILILRD